MAGKLLGVGQHWIQNTNIINTAIWVQCPIPYLFAHVINLASKIVAICETDSV